MIIGIFFCFKQLHKLANLKSPCERSSLRSKEKQTSAMREMGQENKKTLLLFLIFIIISKEVFSCQYNTSIKIVKRHEYKFV